MAKPPFDPNRLLDALVGAVARIGQPAAPSGSAPGGAPGTSPQTKLDLGPQVTQTVQKATGQTPDNLLQKAKNVMEQHPGLAQAAVIGLAGLLFGARKPGRGLPTDLARLGGLAVIGGLAYKAFQNYQSGKPLLDVPPAAPSGGGTSGGSPTRGAATAFSGSQPASDIGGIPEGSPFHPASYAEDDALLFLRAMVAAASADGQVDEAERSRIMRGLRDIGIEPEASSWLEREFTNPADIEELAAQVRTPEKAAQVYAAARVAIDPDTLQEREFLNQLAAALDLEKDLRTQLDDLTYSAKAS
jgi:uncharacterized membrane protein YebE (DUF533 family)